ncbi:MAG TPA: tail fiber protein [Candidatus Acidoferrales bacterium]|nr:tail fiber protein [Candidatus Acidoferrales bacterium]
MASPYLGEIRIVSFGFAPRGWAQCNGQTMAISQNQALFAILGTFFGGNGVSTFALPNLQGLVPYHVGTNNFGTNYSIGQVGGVASVALTSQQIPSHTHFMRGSSASPNKGQVASNLWATQTANAYDPNPTGNMNGSAIGTIGGQPHTNMSPFLTLNFVIALNGIFPSRN